MHTYNSRDFIFDDLYNPSSQPLKYHYLLNLHQWLSGDSGVGKTSLVNLISNTNTKPSWTVGCNVEVIYHESRGI